jgi:hypothetical protein
MANKKFLNPINLVNLSSDPTTADEGDIYYNTAEDAVKVYANGNWVVVGGSSSSQTNIHPAAKLATTANITGTYTPGTIDQNSGYGIGATITATATGRGTIDSVLITTGDRILVKNQATSTQNGVYVVTTQGTTGVSFVLTRATDFNNSVADQVTTGDFLYVTNGTVNATTNWILNSTGTAGGETTLIGTDAITFAQVGGLGPTGPAGPVGAGGTVSHYGSFYSTVDQNATTGGEAVNFDSTNVKNGVTLVTNGTSLTRFTVPATGTYMIDFAGQVAQTGGGVHQVNFWLVKNGTTAVSTAFDTPVSSNDPSLTNWVWQVNATANDYYEVFWNATSTNVYLNAVAAASPVPAAAGAFVRVTQVTYQGDGSIYAKNAEDSTVAAFTPVYINSQTVGLAEITFLKADASISSKMPAVGITRESVVSASSSNIVTQGIVGGITLTGYSDGDLLYVANGGGFTKTRPTGSNAIQPFGRVLSIDNGSIYVYGNTFASSIDSLPNLTSDKIWLGTSGRPVETTLNTTAVPEGTNLYFTDERAQDAASSMITGGTHSGVSVEYVDATNKFNITNTGVTGLTGTTNEIVVSGSTGSVTIGIPDSPVFVTPNIGVATATSVNGTSIPSSKTLVVTTDIGSTVQAYDADLGAIAALTGTSGLLKKTSANTWTLDETVYATSGDITSAVSVYIPANEKGSPSGVAELDIDTKVPVAQIPDLSGTYSLSTHNHSLNSLSNVVITGTPTDGQAIVWDTTTSKWVNETISSGGNKVTVASTAPTSPTPAIGDGWYKNTDGTYYVYDGTYWVEVTSVITMSQEEAQDLVAPLLNHSSHTAISATYDDANNKILLSLSSSLSALSGLTSAADRLPYFTGSGTASLATFTTFGRSLVDDADANAARATLGLGTMAQETAVDYLTSTAAGNTYAPLAGANFTGNIAINNGTSTAITTTGTTATIFNATATTVKIGEAATTISIGNTSHTGTTTINHDLSVYGNITFNGGASQLSATTIQIDDTLISLADNNTADLLDIGFYAGYNDGTDDLHAGLVRDASDSGKWKLFSHVDAQPTDTVDFSNAVYSTLKIGTLEVTNASQTRTNLGLGTMATATASDYLTVLTAGTTYAPINNPTFTGTVGGITKSMIGLGSVENTALSTWTGSTNITTLGTITSGTWSGTAIGISKGGTGLTTLGTAGQVLTVNAGATAAEWKDATGGGGSGGAAVQETPPTSPATGDTWFKNSESILYIYDGSFWVEVNSLLTIPLEDIVELDNMSKQFNGAETRFLPTFNGNMVPITNPYRLLLTINGIIQEMGFPEYVWQSDLPRSGYRIDNDGYIAFSEAPPTGSTFHAKIMAGPTTNTTQKVYAFEATDILLGA